MARVLFDAEWYEQVSTQGLYEEEYERLLCSHALYLFPSYWMLPFKKIIYSEERSAKPDFALIHRGYREWWVVEAELSHHSFEHHVRPQVETLARGHYGEDEVTYLQKQLPELDAMRLRSMIKGYQPRVLVIVNAPVPDWAHELQRYGALITIFEVFRSRHNRFLYRLNGQQPTGADQQSSECSVVLPRMLQIHSPGILSISSTEKISIQLSDGITEWSRLDTGDAVYLVTSEPVRLDPNCTYQLVDLGNHRFALRKSKRGKGRWHLS